jgi:predicted dehydrogenase
MKQKATSNRRSFLKASALTSLLSGINIDLFGTSVKRPILETVKQSPGRKPSHPEIPFAVIGLNHGHIYSQTEILLQQNGILKYFWATEPELIRAFQETYPQAILARSKSEILEDHTIKIIASASIPNERAKLGIEVMQHGKDFLADKPGITSLEQLRQVRQVQKETGRIYSILFGERLENKATIKASELVNAGAIGKVIQTIGLGPHRMNIPSRPLWFFDKKNYGGIICDIGSHQCDQFLHFTGSADAEILHAQTGNTHYKMHPGFEDFGDLVVRSKEGTGYIRVDWFTPDGLDTWGDGRLTILGTEGFIEIRKNTDLAGRNGGSHLFLVDGKSTRYIDCKGQELPFGRQLAEDIFNRTETAMAQNHCFAATELALKAQKQASSLVLDK